MANPDYPEDFKRDVELAKDPRLAYVDETVRSRFVRSITEAFQLSIRNDVDWFETQIPSATIKSIHLERLDDGEVKVRFQVEYQDEFA